VERVATGVDTVVEQALSSSAHELGRRNIFVQCDLAPGLPKITWDPARVVQVLTNLLVNAAQAIGQGGRVVIRARRDEDWLRLEVEDDGAGIPAAHRTRIFDPFFTTKADGTGLGLSISHGIVNEHGGRIEVESRTLEDAEPGGRTGTTVRVIVPIVEVAG
jgi:two-component system NtrC family sensor kinase